MGNFSLWHCVVFLKKVSLHDQVVMRLATPSKFRTTWRPVTFLLRQRLRTTLACLRGCWVLIAQRERERESRLNKRALSLFSNRESESHVKFVFNFKSHVNTYREIIRHGSETLNCPLGGGKKDGSSWVRSQKLEVQYILCLVKSTTHSHYPSSVSLFAGQTPTF